MEGSLTRSGRSSATTCLNGGGSVQVLGIDIGGTGIKAAPVDLTTGTLAAERVKILTPHPALPDAIAGVVQELVKGFGWTGPAGITFPGVVIGGAGGRLPPTNQGDHRTFS